MWPWCGTGIPRVELIRCGDIQRCVVVSGHLEDYGTLERAISEQEVQTVFRLGTGHGCGAAFRSPLLTFESNIRGTYNLLEACRVHRDLVHRIVVASSDKAYGEAAVLPYTEDMPAQGRHPYDVSKSCADLLAHTYAQTYGMNITVARCGNIYGGGDLNWSRIVPGSIRLVLEGKPPLLRSDGTFTRDYLYVEDVVDAYLTLAQRVNQPGVRGEAFNFSPRATADHCPGTHQSSAGSAWAVGPSAELSRIKPEPNPGPVPGLGKARRVLGGSPHPPS